MGSTSPSFKWPNCPMAPAWDRELQDVLLGHTLVRDALITLLFRAAVTGCGTQGHLKFAGTSSD